MLFDERRHMNKKKVWPSIHASAPVHSFACVPNTLQYAQHGYSICSYAVTHHKCIRVFHDFCCYT